MGAMKQMLWWEQSTECFLADVLSLHETVTRDSW